MPTPHLRPGSQAPGHGSAVANDRPASPEPRLDADLRHWLSLAATGDESAFAAFYDASCGRVHGLILTVLRAPGQAAALTQAVYLEIWRCPGALLDRGLPVLAAVLGLAHRRAVEGARQASAAGQAHVPTTLPGSGARERLSLPRTSTLSDVLLTPLQQESLVLSYLGGYTVRQVSALLCLPTAAVSDAITAALAGLASAAPSAP